MLRDLASVEVETIETSCCGMAGAFGYGRESDDVLMKMAEAALLSAVQNADPEQAILADGTSCRCQIGDGTDRVAAHLALYLDRLVSGSAGIWIGWYLDRLARGACGPTLKMQHQDAALKITKIETEFKMTN